MGVLPSKQTEQGEYEKGPAKGRIEVGFCELKTPEQRCRVVMECDVDGLRWIMDGGNNIREVCVAVE